MQYRVISADDHIDVQWMPKDAWTSRVAGKWQDRAPHVEDTERGPFWFCDGQNWGPWGKKSRQTVGGRRWAIERFREFSDDEVPPTDARMRLADMDRDGIDVTVMYGPVGPLRVADPELRKVCYQAYNDWLLEFRGASPERLIPVGMVPNDSPHEASEELERLARLGFRHVNLLAASAKPAVFDGTWEPFWSLAEETGIPVGMHLTGTRREPPAGDQVSELARTGIAYVTVPLSLLDPIVGLVFGGVLERHPGVKIVLAEAGLAWIPYMMKRMDDGYVQYASPGAKEWWDEHGGIPLTMKPSDYCRRQVWVTFQEDVPGLELASYIGEDKIMWGSDYPHPDSTWPFSQKVIDGQMKAVPADLRQKILVDNARQLLGL